MWTELLAIDMLIRKYNFFDIEKIISPKGIRSADFKAIYDGMTCVVEVTRIRQRDFEGYTAPTFLEDCFSEENTKTIRKILNSKLNAKNEQVRAFCESCSEIFARRIVVLKTSQWEYQDCSEVVKAQLAYLMEREKYAHVTDILLIPDVETILWLKNDYAT